MAWAEVSGQRRVRAMSRKNEKGQMQTEWNENRSGSVAVEKELCRLF